MFAQNYIHYMTKRKRIRCQYFYNDKNPYGSKLKGFKTLAVGRCKTYKYKCLTMLSSYLQLWEGVPCVL